MTNVMVTTINKTKVSTYIMLTFMIFSSIALMFFVKYTVYNLRREITVVERNIEKNLEDSKVLDAEWAYLTNPERIRKLVAQAKNFDQYSQIQISQIKDPKLLKTYYSAQNEKFGSTNVAIGITDELYY